MKEHRWSGFPGGFCLDCNADCMLELAIADNAFDAYTGEWASEEAKKKYEQKPCPAKEEKP